MIEIPELSAYVAAAFKVKNTVFQQRAKRKRLHWVTSSLHTMLSNSGVPHFSARMFECTKAIEGTVKSTGQTGSYFTDITKTPSLLTKCQS